MKLIFFENQAQLRKWFEKNYRSKIELYVGFYKTKSGKPSITWPQSVNEALCFGWIDGVRKSIDDDSYYIRFTPRKPTSIWSGINIKKMEEFIRLGLVKPAGLAAFEQRQEHKSRIYSYEKEPVKLSADLEKKFKANKKAWEFFSTQAFSYQKAALNWVMSAKQEATTISRFNNLLADSKAGLRVKHLRPIKK